MYPNWLNNHISKAVSHEKYVKISFSQNGEDDYIRAHFWEKILRRYKGTYLDIGCYDETLYSNTKLLSLAGWNGIAVDANPLIEENWKKARPMDKFKHAIIANTQNKDTEVRYYIFEDGAINTTSKDSAMYWIEKGYKLKGAIRSKTKTMTNLIREITSEYHGFRPNFVNIDIEQVNYLEELETCLSKLQWPELLCIEWISGSYGIENYKLSKEYEILSSIGYEIRQIIGGNVMAHRVR